MTGEGPVSAKITKEKAEQESPFRRFQTVLQRLLAVPKKELDEKLAEFKGRPRKKRTAT
jgi:hypothetical protein